MSWKMAHGTHKQQFLTRGIREQIKQTLKLIKVK